MGSPIGLNPLPGANEYRGLRHAMVRDQIEARGVRDPRILAAFRDVPRHRFVDSRDEAACHSDRALPIGHDQTISQPYMVALQTDLIRPQPDHRVLEVGTGSGYQAAILSRLVREVLGVERIPALVERARKAIETLGLPNVRIVLGDGSLGLPEGAPYDGIIVAAAAPSVPEQLCRQLRVGGRIVIPVGSPGHQILRCVERVSEDAFRAERGIPCAFVPLIGRDGWPEPDDASWDDTFDL